jgi:NADH:ubiquinone oxidoreductase subunit B-like Fe-S oxidoreductase
MSLLPIFSFARAKSLVPLPFIGTVSSRASARWLSQAALSSLGDLSGAGLPRQADLLVVVGEISHKAAPVLQRLYARMADPCYVLHIRGRAAGKTSDAGYCTINELAEVVPVDVTIEGDPPDDDAMAAGLERLRDRVTTRRRA